MNGCQEDLSFPNTALTVKAPGGKSHLGTVADLKNSSIMEIYRLIETYSKKSNEFRKKVVI